MNNQLKLPWIQPYRETPSISRPAFAVAVLATVWKAARKLRHNGNVVPQPELSNGYVAFTTRRHQLR